MHYIFTFPVIAAITLEHLVVCMMPIAIVAIICLAGIIKNRDNNAFKQSMLDRGMSAQDIEQVARARLKAGFLKKHRYSLVRVCVILLLLFLFYDLTNDIDNDISVSIRANHPNFVALYNTSTGYSSGQCVPVVADGIHKTPIKARGVKGIRIDPEVGDLWNDIVVEISDIHFNFNGTEVRLEGKDLYRRIIPLNHIERVSYDETDNLVKIECSGDDPYFELRLNNKWLGNRFPKLFFDPNIRFFLFLMISLIINYLIVRSTRKKTSHTKRLLLTLGIVVAVCVYRFAFYVPASSDSKEVEMMLIQSGTFMMGSPSDEYDRDPNEGPQHQVTLTQNFHMGNYEVMVRQYATFLEATGKESGVDWDDGGCPLSRSGGRYALRDDHSWDESMTEVSWHGAAMYCNYLSEIEGLQSVYNPETWEVDWNANGYRLPTEAEWEYACRAGTQTRYYWGNDPSNKVSQTIPNDFGLYNMSGNRYEWCQDWYGSYSDSNQTDPIGPSSGSNRVLRGGDQDCPSAHRHQDLADNTNSNMGFRVLRSTP